MHALGVDIGGTKIAAGVVDEDGTLLAQVRSESPVGLAAFAVRSCASSAVASARAAGVISGRAIDAMDKMDGRMFTGRMSFPAR